ncbi:MAG: hypothetical protein ACRDFB_07980, partial [Rhabdochlamydiaceae bacterium]
PLAMHFGKKKRNSLKISYGNEENEPKTEVIKLIERIILIFKKTYTHATIVENVFNKGGKI